MTDEINGKYSADLTHDYTFNNVTDDKKGIVIDRDNFVLNGSANTIDAKNQSRIFNITSVNIKLSNLILVNSNAENGGAIYSDVTLILNNVTFKCKYAKNGGDVALYGKNAVLICNNI